MLKKIFSLSLLFVLACTISSQAKTLNVLTTTEDLKSIAESVGGSHIKAESLGRGTQNYHFLAAKPSFMVKAKKTDLFIRNGFELEIGYESLILEGSRNRDIRVGGPRHMDASNGIMPLEVPHVLDRSMGDIHASGNPHYWLDPENVKIVTEHMAIRLGELDPTHQNDYQTNADTFRRLIDQKMIEWKKRLAPYTGEKIITYHKSWAYFAKQFGLTVIEELEPKPGIAPSPSHLKGIIDAVREYNVKLLLTANIYKDDTARFVAGKTQAVSVSVPVSVGGSQEARDYISLIDEIVNALAKGFENGGNY